MATLTIGWLYGDRMNIYGDRGNVIALEQRARWRGIDVVVERISIGDPIPPRIDLYFFGGGQDQQQVAVAADLQGSKGDRLRADIEAGAPALTICGGYQLFAHEYRPHGVEPLSGVGVFDAVTVSGSERFIGNVVIDSEWGELVGFENHSGLTTLGQGCAPMGSVRVGRGNNGRDGQEGARFRNALGCYLHGALLPKNPALTDWLISTGLSYVSGHKIELEPLDDRTERTAHDVAAERARKTR